MYTISHSYLSIMLPDGQLSSQSDDFLVLLVLWQLIVLQLVLQTILRKLHDSKQTLSDTLPAHSAITRV